MYAKHYVCVGTPPGIAVIQEITTMKNLKYCSWLLLLVSVLAAALPAAAQTNIEQNDFSDAELDQMLAPIALYPDTVLSHVLIASTYPLEVVQADRWARDNPGLEAEVAVASVEDQNWDPSVKALVAFPQILERMSDDLAWTQRLGNAFLDNEARVMDTIQNLRNKAYASGSLDRLEHVRVQREKEVIIIEPAVERVVYVPVYDTRVVYGNWWWNDYPPVYWHYPSHVTFVGGFYWGPRIYVGPSFYFSSFHWHKRHVVYVDHRRYNHRPHFYSGRSIVNYSGARHWRHNPTHRRGVAYHNERVRQHYGSNRASYSTVHQQRDNSHLRRDQQLNNPRASRELTGSSQTNRTLHAQREAERVRERLSNGQQGNNSRDLRNHNTAQRDANQRPRLSNRPAEDRAREANSEARAWSNRGNTTLPSRTDPRPELNTPNTSPRENREAVRPGLSNQQAAQQAQRQQQLQRAQQQQIENRSTLGDSRQESSRQETRPLTSTQSTNQRAAPELNRPQVNRPSGLDRSRTLRTESARPTRAPSERSSR